MARGPVHAVFGSDRIPGLDPWQRRRPDCCVVAGLSRKGPGPRDAVAHCTCSVADALHVLAGPDRGGQHRLPCPHLVAPGTRAMGTGRCGDGVRSFHQATGSAAAARGAARQRALEAGLVLRPGEWDSRRHLRGAVGVARDHRLLQQRQLHKGQSDSFSDDLRLVRAWAGCHRHRGWLRAGCAGACLVPPRPHGPGLCPWDRREHRVRLLSARVRPRRVRLTCLDPAAFPAQRAAARLAPDRDRGRPVHRHRRVQTDALVGGGLDWNAWDRAVAGRAGSRPSADRCRRTARRLAIQITTTPITPNSAISRSTNRFE